MLRIFAGPNGSGVCADQAGSALPTTQIIIGVGLFLLMLNMCNGERQPIIAIYA